VQRNQEKEELHFTDEGAKRFAESGRKILSDNVNYKRTIGVIPTTYTSLRMIRRISKLYSSTPTKDVGWVGVCWLMFWEEPPRIFLVLTLKHIAIANTSLPIITAKETKHPSGKSRYSIAK